MKVETTRFGPQEIHKDSIIYFPNGLFDDTENKEFKLFHKEGDESDPVVFWLQSTSNPDIAYTIINPALLGFYYELALPDEDYQFLESQKPEDIIMMVIITGAEEGEAKIQKEGLALINGNVTLPLFINLSSKRAMQRSIKDLEYEIFINIPVTQAP